MDLLAVTSGVVGAVNPLVPMQLQISTGSTTAADGTQTPSYAPATTVMGQVQPLTYKDLKQLDGLNIQGSINAIYFEGHIDAIVRPGSKGGDLITDPDGNVWLTTQVLEHWPDWTKVAVTLQNGS